MGATFLERLAELRGDTKQAEFARRVGVPVTTLRQYDSGSLPSIEIAARIADGYGVSLDWLVGRSTAPVVDEGRVLIPRFDQRASAGAGALTISPKADEYLSVGKDWLRRNLPPWAPLNSVVGVLEGAGDSMWPTIHDGDLIMVVQDVDWRVVERGGVFVFSLDEERLLLKRLQVLLNGDLKIISDNKAYEPETIAFEDIQHRVIIHGMVFFVGGKPRSYGG